MQEIIKPQSRLRSRENSSTEKIDLKVVYRRTDDLKLDPNNPRRHSKKQIRQIGNSIETFGFNVPILIDSAT